MLKELEYLYHKIPDYRITPFLSIKHPTYKEIAEYGESKYVELLYILCLTPDDYKSELDDAGYDWEKVDTVSWFYLQIIPQLRGNQICDILFSSDITSYQVYENAETKERVLYNPNTNQVLTENHIKLIKEHLNSMIGNLYKVHRERAANETTKKILIEEDRQKKKYNLKKTSGNISIKDVILNVLSDKFYITDIYGIDGIREKCGLSEDDNSVSMTADHAFMLGEMYILKKMAADMYKDLKGGVGV